MTSTVPLEKPETLRVRSVVDTTIQGGVRGGGLWMARGWHYTKISLSNVLLLSFSGMCCVLLFLSFDIFLQTTYPIGNDVCY